MPEILLFLLALVVLAGPTPPARFAADEGGGGGAELEEGGRDLERERDAGEGVCRVLGGPGRDGTMIVVGLWWKKGGVEGKETEGRSVLFIAGRVELNHDVVDKSCVRHLADSLLLLHWWWWRKRKSVGNAEEAVDDALDADTSKMLCVRYAVDGFSYAVGSSYCCWC